MRSVVLVCVLGVVVESLSELTVKILTQGREASFERLLRSLEAASYPKGKAVIDVEIYVDGVESKSWLKLFRKKEDDRAGVLAVAEDFRGRWHYGDVSVVVSEEQRGIRGAWLECASLKVAIEELPRFIVFEDDVEVSAAWFEYLSKAVSHYARKPGIAGISLQRQASRLDGVYADDDEGNKKSPRALKPLDVKDQLDGDLAYLFPHVGSWGFAPEPRVWAAFLKWFSDLEDPDVPSAWSVGTNGEAFDEGPYVEALPSRWYRRALTENRGERKGLGSASTTAMWTAHFDAFCAQRGLFVLHAEVGNCDDDGSVSPAAVASSWREDGEHYQGLSAMIETPLLTTKAWNLIQQDNKLFPESLKIVALSGARLSDGDRIRAAEKYERRFLLRKGKKNDAHRKLLDVDWELTSEVASRDVAAAVQGDLFGYEPLKTMSREEALCVLDGKKVAILGDSITRYFAFALNYFLKFGEIGPEFGEVNGGCETWGCSTRLNGNVYVDSDYFDRGDLWHEGTDRSGSRNHRQHITASFADEDGKASVDTEFWFIQDTWFGDLATLAESIRSTHDVLIVNSGWWEFVKSDDDYSSTSCPATSSSDVDNGDLSLFYADEGCTDAYETDLKDMVTNLLQYFGQGNGKALVWRQTSCCGANLNGQSADAVRRSATAVSSFNVVAEKILAENGLEVADVSSLQNTVNTGLGDPDDSSGRTWDGAHPRANQNHLWVQIILNKIARQLGRELSCLPTPMPTATPTTSAPTAETCRNDLKDGDETDVDCGGSCRGCDISGICVIDNDCKSRSCLGERCVLAPTAAPNLAPTAAPVTPSPTPQQIPVPFPTSAPTNAGGPSNGQDEGDGGGFEYGNGDNIREEVTFEVGNATFSCSNSNDGIIYEKDSFAPNDCPTGGQKLLLALLAAIFLSHLYASAYLRPHDDNDDVVDANKGVKGSSALENHHRNHNNTRAAASNNHAAAGPVTKGGIEDELSRSALQVLHQMESLEEAKSLASPQPMHKNRQQHGIHDGGLSSVLEDEALNESSHIELQRMNSESQNQKRTSQQPHSNNSSQVNNNHHHKRTPPAPRTTASLVNRSIMVSAVGHRSTTSYHEPHLASGRHSSVAFSFYDCGDSDDDDDDSDDDSDEESDDGLPDAEAVVPRPPKAAKKAPPLKIKGRTFAATSIGLQFALFLGICVVCEHGMPSGLLPAGSTTVSENIDLFTFLVASLFLVSYINVETLDDGADVFLSRAQANEWKGWMQVAFVAYHYTNAQDVYVPIRWAVSAYVWLTGFGNAVYFWTSADFSAKRFAQQLWRINFLAAFLSLATGTSWIEYYFVALANVHFVIIFLALMAARYVGKLLSWPEPNKKTQEEACLFEKILGVALVVCIDCALWLDDRGDGKGPYDILLRWWLRDISDYFEWYFYLRTKMDYLSSVPGMVFAIAYVPLRDAWAAGSLPRELVWGLYLISAGLLAVAIWVAARHEFCCASGADYRRVNPYIGTLWIPFYLLVRNAHPWLTQRVAKPIEWIGMHSLEFYLLQFHVFLTKQSKRVLYIIPFEDWGYTNMTLCLFLYVLMSAKALELTNAIRTIVWRATKLKVAITAAWSVIAYILLADRWSVTSCDTYTWAIWTVLALIAIALALYWTISS